MRRVRSDHRGISGRGFTLLEVMLAVAIFGGILGAIYACWSSVLRASRAGIKASLDAQRLRVAVRCLEESLTSTLMFQDGIAYYAFLTDTEGDYASISFTSRLPRAFPGGGLFDDQPVRRVTFTVEPGRDGMNELIMRQEALLSALDKDEPPYQLSLARDVSFFALEFWDASRSKWLDKWVATNNLPKLLRFSLGVGSPGTFEGRPEEMVSRLVQLPGVIPRATMMGQGVLPPAGAPGGGGTPGGLPGQPIQPGGPGGGRPGLIQRPGGAGGSL